MLTMRMAALLAGSVLLVACGGEAGPKPDAKPEAKPQAAAPAGPLEVNGLKTAAAFAGIAEPGARSQAIFGEMAKVLQHPRCLNCHPRGDAPSQGDAMAAHNPPVVRGPDGHGPAGMPCATCHGATNVRFTGAAGSVPGDPHWHLAPLSMGWQGLSAGELCAALKDPARNGGRSLAQIVAHHGTDTLVGWAWNPGEGRAPAPGDQATFGALTQAWAETGAGCPG